MLRAPGADDRRMSWILAEVNKAQDTLDAKVAEAQALPDTHPGRADRLRRYRAMKTEVDATFLELDRNILTWANRDVDSMYKSGWLFGATQTGAGMDFNLIHKDALKIIADNAYDDVATGLLSARDDWFSKISRQELFEGMDPGQILAIQDKSRTAVAQALLTGEADPRKVARGLADELWEDGIQITDAGGRKWKMESYTRMLVRTKSANAYNAGSLNKYSEEGITRVTVFDGVLDDEECADANGKTWSLRYAMNHPIAHPNCRRAFSAKPGKGLVHRGQDTKQINPSTKVAIKRTAVGIDIMLHLIREFRNPEQFQASANIAELAVAGAANIFGIPPGALFFLDEFASGLFARPLRELDDLVEGTLNPAIFAAKLVDELPAASRIAELNTATDIVQMISKAVVRAGVTTFPGPPRPSIKVLSSALATRGIAAARQAGILDDQLDWIVRAIRSEKLNFIDVLGVPQQQVNRYGRILGEVLHQWSLGDDLTLKATVLAATATVDELLAVRKSVYDLYRADAAAVANLQGETELKLFALRAVLGGVAEEADLIRVEAVFKADRDVFDNRVFRNAMEEVVEELEKVAAYADTRVYETSIVLKKAGLEPPVLLRRAGVEPMDDGVTAAHNLLDVDEMQSVANDLTSRLATLEATGFNSEGWEDLRALITRIHTRAATEESFAVSILPGIVRAHETNPLNLEILGLADEFGGTGVTLTRLQTLELLENHMSRFEIRGGGIGRGLREVDRDIPPLGSAFYDGVPVEWDDPRIAALVESMRRVDTSFFFTAETSWIDDILEGPDPRQLFRVLGDIDDPDVMGDATGALFFQLFKDIQRAVNQPLFAASLIANERILSPVDIRRVLSSFYGSANVSELGVVGANGALFSVTDELGRKFVVKSIHASAGSGPVEDAILSYGLSSWMDDLVSGGTSAITTTIIEFDGHRLYLGLMPYLDDGTTLEGIVEDVAQQSTRRLRLFDLLSMQQDAHGENNLARLDSLIGYSIDNELAMGARDLALGLPFTNTQLAGHGGISRRMVVDRAIRDWKPGFTDDMFEVGGPVTLYKVTGEEGKAFVTQIGGPHVRDTASSRFDLLHMDLPFVSSQRKDITLPLGRVTSTQADRFGVIGKTAFTQPRILVTPKEREILQQMIDGDDALRESLRAELVIIFDSMTPDTLNPIVVQYGGDLDEVLDEMTELALDNMKRQASMLVDTGMLAPDRIQSTVSRGGVELAVGKGFQAADVDDTTAGLVNAIYRNGEGDLIVEYYPGLGLDRTGADVFNEGASLLRKRVDDLFPTVEASENFQLASKLDNTTEALTRAADVEPTHATALGFPEEVRTTLVPVLSEDGIQIGRQREWIPMHVEGRLDDGLRLVAEDVFGEQDPVRVVTWSEIVDSGILQDIIQEELLAVPDTHRPRQITLYLSKLETADGVPSLGFFDPATRHMHLSLVGGLSEGRLAGQADAWRASGDTVYEAISDLLADELRDGPFRRLVRHELAHGVEVGIEEADRVVIRARVWEELLEELQGAVHTDGPGIEFNLRRLIPDEFPADDFDSLVDAVVAYRVQLIEDVMHTNVVHQVNDIFEEALTGGELPTWAARAYDEILRREPNSHHEFFAELYARVIASGGTDEAISKAARELGVDETTVRQIVFRDIPPSPENWDILSDEFTDWILEVLDSRSRNVVPLDRSLNRRLWKKASLDTDGIVADIRRQLDPDVRRGTGATVHVITGERPSTGVVVARGANEVIIKNADPEKVPKLVSDYVNKASNRNFLEDPSNEWFLGMWIESDGSLTLDVVRQFDSPIDAAIFGFKEGQRTGFDFDTGYEKYLDGFSDFQEWWDNVGRKAHELRIGRKITAAEEDALTQRVGAAFANLEPPTRREVRGTGGKHLPIGMDVFDDAGQRLLTNALENRYVFAVQQKVKGRTTWVPTTESINMTKRKVKNRLRRVLEEAERQYGFVDRSLDDVEWNAARNIRVRGSQKAVRKVFDDLDRLGVDIPRGTFDGKNTDQVIEEVARLVDLRGTKNRALTNLGFEENFAEAFRLVVTGQASEELTSVMLGFSFSKGKFVSTGLIDIAEGKALRIVHRFYEDWHAQYKAASIREGHQMQKLVGVAAGLSPGMLAEVNRDAAIFMLNTVKANPELRGRRVTDLKNFIRGQIENIKKESIRKNGFVTVKQQVRITHLERVISNIRGGHLSELSDDAGAFAVAMLASESGIKVSMADGSIAKLTMVGAYGMPQVVRTYRLATGRSPIDDVLGNTKTRSFFNNIMDPKDLYGAGDVTIDFHMANAAFRIIGMQDIFHAKPNVLGMEAGLRPIIGDIVRELFAEGWGDRVHSDSPGELQEVIWAIWRAIAERHTKGTLTKEDLRWLGGPLRRVQIDPRWKKP